MIDDSQKPTRHVRETSSYGDLEQDANLLKSAQQRGLSEEASLRQLKMRRDPKFTSEVYEKFKAKPQHDPKTYLPGPEEEEFAFDESGPTQVGPSEAEARRLAEEDERYVAGLPPYKQQSARAARKAARQAEMRLEQPNYYDPNLPEAADEPAAEAEAAVEMPPHMERYDRLEGGGLSYKPKSDPYEYTLSKEGTFTVINPATGAVEMTAPKGHPRYQAFVDHLMGDPTEFTRGKAAPPAPDEAAVEPIPELDQVSDDEAAAEEGAKLTDQILGEESYDDDAAQEEYNTQVGLENEILSEDLEDTAPPRPRVERGGSMGLGSYKEQEGRAEQARMLKGNREAFHGQMRELFGREAPEKPPYMEGGELTEEAVTTGPYRLVSPDGTVINKRVAAQIARGELDPAAWASFSEGLKGSGRIKWDMGPSVEDLLADEGFVRSVGGTPTRVAARRALDAAQQ